MAAPLDAPLAPFLTLTDGMSIRLTALDASTGATVAGVTISNRSISVDPGVSEEGPPAKLEEYVPAFTYGVES